MEFVTEILFNNYFLYFIIKNLSLDDPLHNSVKEIALPNSAIGWKLMRIAQVDELKVYVLLMKISFVFCVSHSRETPYRCSRIR